MKCVSFDKINVLQMFKTFHPIYRTRMFITQAQKPLTGLYPQSDDPAQLPQKYFCVLYGSQYKQRLFPYTTLTLRRLMSCIYMEHPFLMFLDHTQRRTTVGRTPLDE